MLQKLLILVPLEMALFVISSFGIFAAFHYCNDSKPEKIFLCFVGVIGYVIMVFTLFGLLNLV
jgi:hypothetical protein